MINLPRIDIHSPEDNHVVGTAQDPVMPRKDASAGAIISGNQSRKVSGSVTDQGFFYALRLLNAEV